MCRQHFCIPGAHRLTPLAIPGAHDSRMTHAPMYVFLADNEWCKTNMRRQHFCIPGAHRFNREKIQKRCTSSRAPTHQSFTTIIGLATLQCIFTRMQATCACAIIPTHIPFGGTKVSFEMKTCKNIPGREHIQSGIIILHGKNQWDNFSGKPNIH